MSTPAYASIIERATSEEFLNSIPDYNTYWPHPKTALFQDDSTGEAVFVSVETFPRYYYPRDTASFWQEEAGEKRFRRDLIVSKKQPWHDGDLTGYRYALTDTNTTRCIAVWVFLQGDRLFRVVSLSDSLQPNSEFLTRFYASFRPLDRSPKPSVFENKLDTFFRDFYSSDSLVAKKAKDAIPNVYFGPAGVPLLLKAIRTLPYNGTDYFETKTRLINELGYINDSASIPAVVAGLRDIYDRAGDTSTLQNAVFKALAHHKTAPAYGLLRQLMTQDPPVFDNGSDYTAVFRDIGDSLPLARTLFPGLLQLAAVDDYKTNIQSLLSDLVDSGYLQSADYDGYFSQIYFDAKIQWKKQKGKDEKRLQKKEEDGGDDNVDAENEDNGNMLGDYAILLQPFYGRNQTIPHFFDRLLQSRDPQLRMNTALLLLRHRLPVADSILLALAADDATRSPLFQGLTTIGREDAFPRQYRTQEYMARSLLVSGHGTDSFAAVDLIDKQPTQFKQKKGTVYFFTYKINKDDEWLIGLSGIQPQNRREISTDPTLVVLTGKRLRNDVPFLQQFEEQWRRLLLSRRKSAITFFQDNEYAIRQEDD